MAAETAFQSVPVLEVIPQTSDTQTLRLGTTFPYKAGQSIQVQIPGDPKKRYYSISSSPTEKGHIDITIKAQRGTPLFQSLFSIKSGGSIAISGPLGSFTIPEGLAGPFYFLAAGSGVTPFRSMAKFLMDTQSQAEIWMLHSVQTPNDLIFKDEFLLWEGSVPLFHYVPTFTRSDQVVAGAETGRIREQLIKKHLPIEKGTFFLCGMPAFSGDMEKMLTQNLQIPPSRIRREQW